MNIIENKLEKRLVYILLFVFTIHSLLFKSISNNLMTIIIYLGLICGIIFIKVFLEGSIKKNDIRSFIVSVVAILPILIYGYNESKLFFLNTETIRYSLFFLICVLWNDVKISDIKVFHIIIIIFGFLCCMYQISNGITRPSGFLNSPTIFSCMIALSITYLLFEKNVNIFNYIFILIGIFEIYISESSSSLLIVFALILYKIFINFIISKKEKKADKMSDVKKKKILIFIGIASVIAGIYFVNNINALLSIIQRNNRDASTSTRIEFIMIFINQFIHSVKMFFIGNGGGYTQAFIIKNLVSSHHMPLHQDILMLLIEYGLLGFLYIYNFFIKKLKLNYILLIILILFSFHNIILCPYVMCSLIISNNSLNIQYKNNKIFA